MFEHEHPLNLIDMLSKHINYEEESDEDDDEKDLVTKPDFEYKCDRCGEKINWYHRYYYKCDQCQYSIHKFCQELSATFEYVAHSHTLTLQQNQYSWWCVICRTSRDPHHLLYGCYQCYFKVDIKCAIEWLRINIIYHPSHIHPLVCIAKNILCECDACGKEHKGVFYQCAIACPILIHNECIFLPQKLQIQQTTNNLFPHPHPLTLAYSLSNSDREIRFYPKCRVCQGAFRYANRWIYKCEKCRFYAHLDCATSREEPFMSILKTPGTGKLVKNYGDDEYPNLLHLPFPDETYSLPKHLFYKETGSMRLETNDMIQTQTHISHQHPLILVDATTMSSSSRILKRVSYHNPMTKIQVLCNGCVKPITNPPFYMCANEDENCNFVLHEWCTQLPANLNDHPGHPQHPLVYYPKIPFGVLGVFNCAICRLPSNGFVYCCVECRYYVDIFCAFIPEEVTHKVHPNHLLSRVRIGPGHKYCRLCKFYVYHDDFAFSCIYCDIYVHPACALLVSETIRQKYDKHPMKLSYFPIENHKSKYFCEICEEELDPNISFYHCHDCAQSVHSACVSGCMYTDYGIVNEFVNTKFGGIYNVAHLHQHPLSLIQGIQSDDECNSCRWQTQYNMILKCLQCNFVIHFRCFEDMYHA